VFIGWRHFQDCFPGWPWPVLSALAYTVIWWIKFIMSAHGLSGCWLAAYRLPLFPVCCWLRLGTGYFPACYSRLAQFSTGGAAPAALPEPVLLALAMCFCMWRLSCG